MAEKFDWLCRCGTVHLTVASQNARPVICYCNYCRHFARDFGEGDQLDPGGGVRLLHVTPDAITVESGAEKIGCVAYSRRGALRWIATCCGTPLANTPRHVGMAYVTMPATRLTPADEIGPPMVRGFPKSAIGPVIRPAGFAPYEVARIGVRLVLARLDGRWRKTPFFTRDGKPVAEPERRPGPGR